MTKEEYFKTIDNKLKNYPKEEVNAVKKVLDNQINKSLDEGKDITKILTKMPTSEDVEKMLQKKHPTISVESSKNKVELPQETKNNKPQETSTKIETKENLEESQSKLKNIINELLNDFQNLWKIMKDCDSKTNLNIIKDLLFLLLVIILLKIPFIFVRSMLDSFLVRIEINNFIYSIYGILIEILYIFVAIIVFIRTFKKWYANLKVTPKAPKPIKKETPKPIGEELTSISLTDNDNNQNN